MQQPRRPQQNHWPLALAAIIFTATMGVIATALITSLPTIQTDLNLSNAQMQWLMTGYAIFGALSICFSGQMADRFGRIKTFLFGATFVIAGTILGCIGTDYWLIILCRVLQGFGAGITTPISIAIVKIALTKDKQQRGLLLWGFSSLLGFGLGPLFGGLFTTFNHWQLLFWIAVGLLTTTALIISINLHKETTKRKSTPIDSIGALLLAIFLILFTLLFSEAVDWGWTSAAIITLIAVTPVALLLFLLSQRYSPYPVSQGKLLRNRTFIIGSLLMSLSCAGIYSFPFIYNIAFQAAGNRAYSAFYAGVTVMLVFLVVLPLLIISHYKKQTPPYLSLFLIGFILQLAGFITCAFIFADTGYVNIWWRLVLIGIGLGLVWLYSPAYVMSNVDDTNAGSASALFEIFRYIGVILGLCLSQMWYLASSYHVLAQTPQAQALHLSLTENKTAWQQYLDGLSISGKTVAIKAGWLATQSGFQSAMWMLVIFSGIGLVIAGMAWVKR